MAAEDAVHTEIVTLMVDDTELVLLLAQPATAAGRRPGVLVLPEWWGMTDYPKRRARMLAELGYAALAVDMYGGGQTADNPDDAGRLMNGVMGDIGAAEARLKAALEYLQSRPNVDPERMGAIGYCMGGALALHAARIGLPLAGVVSFHGALGSFHQPAPGGVHAKILVCHGGADALVPEDTVAAFKQEMTEAGAEFKFVTYPGALHGFSNPAADANGRKFGLPLAYDADTDRKSWQAMQDFLEEVFA